MEPNSSLGSSATGSHTTTHPHNLSPRDESPKRGEKKLSLTGGNGGELEDKAVTHAEDDGGEGKKMVERSDASDEDEPSPLSGRSREDSDGSSSPSSAPPPLPSAPPYAGDKQGPRGDDMQWLVEHNGVISWEPDPNGDDKNDDNGGNSSSTGVGSGT